MKKQRILSLLLSLAMVFSLLPAGAAAVNVKTFEDVSKDAWYYDYVKYVANKEYFVGTSKTTFSPEMPMTRAMFVTVLAAVEKVKVNNNVSPFADVPANTWYSGAVAWAAEKGVVAGVGDNKFDPNAAITREQMAVMMNAYIKWTGNDHKEKSKVESFKDADKISSWAKDAVEACRNWGLVAGMPDGNFWPANTASRAEVATVIKNLAFMVYGGGGGGGGSDTEYTDYIKAAVEKSVEIFNDKMPNGADAYGSGIYLSDLKLNAQALTLIGTVEANAETIEKLADFAVSKAAEIVGALSAGDEADAIIEENKALIADKAEEIANAIINKLNGFFGTSLDLDELNKAAIKENIKAAYENGVAFGKDAWTEAFMVDGKAVTGNIVVSVGSAEVTVEVDGANLSIEGKATDAVKTLAVAIAKDLYAQLIDVDSKTAVTAIDPSVEVGILFSAGEYAEDTNEFPYAYTLTLTADLEGTAADNIEYWFKNGEHNVNLVVSEKMTEMYEGYAEEIVSQVTALAMDKAAETVTGTSVSGYINPMISGADLTSATVSALPEILDSVLDDAANNPASSYADYADYANIFLSLDPAVQEYAKAVILDQLLVDAGVLAQGESHFVKTEAPAMDITEMKDMANDLGVDTSKYDVIIDKVEKLQDPAYIKTLTLGDLASAIETLDEKGIIPEIVDKFVVLVDMLPEGASVTVKGVEVISKSALAGDDAVEIVVDMLNKIGDLSLKTIEESGVDVKAAYGARSVAVNLFINK